MEGAVPSNDDFANTAPTSIPNSNIIEDSHSANNVFCRAVLGDATTGTFYTKLTGAFPVTSLESMQAYCVAYDYNTNTMFAKPCPDFNDAIIIAAFEEVFNKLKANGYEPNAT